jgi:electron transfer flavoprotein alpha subunit
MSNVLVVAELFEGSVRKSTLAAVTFAKKVSEKTGGSFSILALGSGIDEAVSELAKYGAESVYKADGDSLAGYICEAYAPTVAKVAADNDFGVVVAPASNYGKDLMPRVAQRLEAGMASDISGFDVDGDTITYTRPVYAGNVIGYMTVKTERAVVTVRQTEFDAAEPTGSDSSVVDVDVEDPSVEGKELAAFDKVESARPDLTEARVIVSGGRGLKNAENFKMLEELTDLLGGALGATRAAVDAGFVPNDLQVGQTGKIVAPELYVAVGLSGALQHLAGMKGSKVIVAINKDEEAPIFSVADYGLVADLFQAVPEMISSIKAG